MEKRLINTAITRSAQWLHKHSKVMIIVASCVSLATIFLYVTAHTAFALQAKIDSASAHPVDAPVVIRLNQAIKSIDTHAITIQPAAEGTWSRQQGNLINSDTLTFTPHKNLITNTTYKINFTAVARLFAGDTKIPATQFTTERAPALSQTGVAALADGTTVAADTAFSVSFASPINHLRTLVFTSSPAVTISLQNPNDHSFTWQPTSLLPQGQPLTVTITDTQNNEVLVKKTLTVAPEPHITDYVKTNHFTPSDTATISFDQPIDPVSSKFITFDTAGEGS